MHDIFVIQMKLLVQFLLNIIESVQKQKLF